MRFFFVLLLSLFCFLDISAQHEIHKKDGEVLLVKIISIGLDDVTYLDPLSPDIQRTIAKQVLVKIVLDNGREEMFKDPLMDPVLYADHRNRALKFNFLSPLVNYYIELAYEQNLRPGRSIEGSLGYIGVGQQPDRFSFVRYTSIDFNSDFYRTVDESSSRGGFFRLGYRFTNTPTFSNGKTRYTHILKGGYVKPELVLGAYSFFEEYHYLDGRIERERETAGFASFLINVGKQWVFDDVMLLDLYAGLGYGLSFGSEFRGDFPIALPDRRNDLSVAFTGGVKVGYLLPNKD